MDYRTCAVCGVPVAEDDLPLHCILDGLDLREAEREAAVGALPPRPPVPGPPRPDQAPPDRRSQ